jgi:hypothetical protein
MRRRPSTWYVAIVSLHAFMERVVELGTALLVTSVLALPPYIFLQLFLGDTNRVIGATKMNQSSSRSHCIFTLYVEARKVSILCGQFVLLFIFQVQIVTCSRLFNRYGGKAKMFPCLMKRCISIPIAMFFFSAFSMVKT